jgi:F-type H+-transporting ATPase subunit b
MAQKVTSGTTSASETPGHGKGFPPLDPGTFAPQLIWLALTFGLLYVLLKRFYLPRVGEVIQERQDRVARDLEQADKIRADTQYALSSYEQALADARGKANAIAKGMRDQLAAEMDKERAAVEAQIALKLSEAETRITQTKSKALASVNDIAGEVATEIVTKLIGGPVSKDELRKALVTRRAAE